MTGIQTLFGVVKDQHVSGGNVSILQDHICVCNDWDSNLVWCHERSTGVWWNMSILQDHICVVVLLFFQKCHMNMGLILTSHGAVYL